MDKKFIRNFSIIAHIDHGKSTLADRILEFSNSVTKRELKSQMLDTMDLERERGITIKLNAIQIKYIYKNETYFLNLIDTPGHVDFTYEVSRSLAASEGVLLLIDATQGVQSQTIANMYLALENNLTIIPIINKIDMDNAEIEKTKQEIKEILGMETIDIPLISAKTGQNIEQVFMSIIKDIPFPNDADDKAPTKALIFDSYYDSYKGIFLFIRIKSGILSLKDKIYLIQTEQEAEIIEIGINNPFPQNKEQLTAGETGWIIINLRDISKIRIGDTITNIETKLINPLPGYKTLKPMVFSGFYPIDTNHYPKLIDALEKIKLSDSSLIYQKETSQALGFGFRIGFLGLLHIDIIKERIEREYNIPLIITSPSVIYKINYTNKKIEYIQNPAKFPNRELIASIEEPYVKLTLFCPQTYIGSIMEYVHSKRGNYIKMDVLSEKVNSLIYEIPLAEIVFDFFNNIKSLSKGYASFDYNHIGYRVGNLVKMEILVANEPIDALSTIVDKSNAYYFGRDLTKRLKDVLPRQNFEMAIQAKVNNKIIARETIKAYRKDVTGYLYGGDVTRKKKLLEKQKKGKKKMKKIGKIEIPQDTFIKILINDKK